MLTLRPYQQEAVDAVYRYLRERDDNPCLVLPTGAGKSLVMATLCRDALLRWNGRVLILAHVRELLQQMADKLRQVCPEVRFGVYSAGLRRRDTGNAVIVAGIQSVYQRACELDRFDLILIDEAHSIPVEGDGMYVQFLNDAKVVNPCVRVVGLTATPFRLKSGLICTPEHFLNAICFEVGVRELIRDGYLCPLVTKAGAVHTDTSRLTQRDGEFVADEVQALMNKDELVRAACEEVVEQTRERKACLIFCSGVEHGRHVRNVIQAEHGQPCGFVCGKTPSQERDRTLQAFQSGELKYLANMNVLTTGFDAPHIDCVVLLRPTLSTGLYCQMLGRGFRLSPGKQNCLVLDFGENVLRHGPVDAIRISEPRRGKDSPPAAKECPECRALIAAGYATCPECGFTFPPRERGAHSAEASSDRVLAVEVTDTRYDVLDVLYSVHRKKNAKADDPSTMRVDYRLGLEHRQSEFICFEHTGYARQKAITWWKRRSPDPVPATVSEAVDLASAGALAATHSITVRSIEGEKFDRIVDYELGAVPEGQAALEEVPF